MLKGFEGVFSKSEVKPEVCCFVVNKDANQDKAKLRIKEAGFTVASETEQGDCFVYAIKEASKSAHQYAVKFDEDIAVHVTASKALDLWGDDSVSFKELFSKQGVLPSINTATYALQDVIYNAAFKDEVMDGATLSGIVAKACDEYKETITAMLSSLPATAFKMEDPSVLAAVAKAYQETPAEDAAKEDSDEDKEPEDEGKKEHGASDEEDEDEDKKNEDKASDKEDDEDTTEDEDETKDKDGDKGEDETAQKSESEPEEKNEGQSEILQVLKSLTDELSSLKESVTKLEGLDEKFTGLESQLEDVAQIAKKADEAASGTIAATAQDDRATTQKSQGKRGRVTLRDTGYSAAKI